MKIQLVVFVYLANKQTNKQSGNNNKIRVPESATQNHDKIDLQKQKASMFVCFACSFNISSFGSEFESKSQCIIQ